MFHSSGNHKLNILLSNNLMIIFKEKVIIKHKNNSMQARFCQNNKINNNKNESIARSLRTARIKNKGREI